MDIPDISLSGLWLIDFGTLTSGPDPIVLTWIYTWAIQVTDWRALTWWSVTIRMDSELTWQNTTQTINSTGFLMKQNDLDTLSWFMDDIIPDEYYYVDFWTALQDYSNISLWTPSSEWTVYIKKTYDDEDFMCRPWIYEDNPEFRLVVPPYTSPDTYKANIYISVDPV